jgi:hypothetical protein
VPEVLLIAAGGGGDVIGAVMLAQTLGMSPKGAAIATVAWERLLVDPVPGPRAVEDFDGLRHHDGTHEILATSRAHPPFGSLLPQLRQALGYPLFLLDPYDGAQGLVHQLEALRRTLSGRAEVWLLDVGGDVLATGSEPGLRSPLCDALTLAACTRLNGDPQVLVAGPGMDGELTAQETRDRMSQADATPLITLTTPSPEVLDVFRWHPSEASALLAASAMGIRGLVEIRDAGTQVELTDDSPGVWAMSSTAALDGSLAELVMETESLAAAEDALMSSIGATELDYERRKANELAGSASYEPEQIDDSAIAAVHAFERAASERGSRYTTFRRLAESSSRARRWRDLREVLATAHPDRLTGPLWRLP